MLERRGVPKAVLSLLLFAFLGGCYGEMEEVPLGSDLLTSRDKFFAVHAFGAEEAIVCGYKGKILRTRDGGRSWQRIASPTRKSLYAIHFADASHGWIVGQEGTILSSRDGGQSWQEQSSGVAVHLFGVDFITPQRGWAVGARATLLLARDGGEHWEGKKVPLSSVGVHREIAPALEDPTYYYVDFLDEQTGWIIGDYGNIRSTRDGGVTWDSRHASLLGQQIRPQERKIKDAMDMPSFFTIRFLDGRYGLVTGIGGALAETRDGGEHWQFLHPSLPVNLPLYDLVFLDGAGKTLISGGESQLVIHSQQRWQVRRLPTGLSTWIADLDFADDRHGWAVGGHGTILRTEDGGRSWTSCGAGRRDYQSTAEE